MKVEVIKKFRDKETGIIHRAGETLTVSKKRFSEIQKVGDFVKEIADEGKDEDNV